MNKTINAALFCLALGFLASPTIVALYHILIIVPALVLIAKNQVTLKLPKSSYFLLGFFIWGVATTLWQADTIINLNKSLQELKFPLFGVLCIYPLAFFINKYPKSPWVTYLKVVSVVIIVAYFVGITKAWFKFDIKHWTYDPSFHGRSDGLTNVMRYGYACGLLFTLGLGIYLNRKHFELKLPKIFYAGLIFSFLGVFAAQTRGAVLGMMVSIPFLIYPYYKRLAIGLVSLGSLFGLVLIVGIATGQFKHRMLNLNDGSNQLRKSQFQAAYYAIAEKPWVGHGSDQFSYQVKRIKLEHQLFEPEYQGHSHNIFLESAASFGIPGFLFIFCFFACWIFEMKSSGHPYLKYTVVAYIMAFVVAGQVENLFENTNSHLMYFVYSFSQVIRINSQKKQS